MQTPMDALPWTLLGLPADFALPHLALVLDTGDSFVLDHGEAVSNTSDPAIFGEPDNTDRFGHVVLHTAVVHPLMLVLAPDLLARQTGVSAEGLRQLVDWQRWVVIDAARDSGVEVGSLVDEVAAEELRDEPVELASGPAAIERLLALRGRPSVCLARVRVLPIGLRPSPLFGLDDLLRRLVNRTVRLRRLIELEAPEIIVRNEIIMTQAAVEGLFCNEASTKPFTGAQDRILQSLLGLVGGVALVETLRELDARVAHSGPAALTTSLPLPLLRTVRITQALHLELHPIR
jgi:hypothetical protein